MAEGIEDETTAGGERATRWEWMRRFRFWEANRKDFVYPENVLEPDLRDDKSALFDEAESALADDQIDAPAETDR